MPTPPKPTHLTIRNSTAEFLMFSADSHVDGIEVRYEDENVWLSQKMMATLFDVDMRTISEHLKYIYEAQEISAEATLRKFQIVRTEGTSQEAKVFAESQWEQYRIIQDRIFESDFDREVKKFLDTDNR